MTSGRFDRVVADLFEGETDLVDPECDFVAGHSGVQTFVRVDVEDGVRRSVSQVAVDSMAAAVHDVEEAEFDREPGGPCCGPRPDGPVVGLVGYRFGDGRAERRIGRRGELAKTRGASLLVGPLEIEFARLRSLEGHALDVRICAVDAKGPFAGPELEAERSVLEARGDAIAGVQVEEEVPHFAAAPVAIGAVGVAVVVDPDHRDFGGPAVWPGASEGAPEVVGCGGAVRGGEAEGIRGIARMRTRIGVAIAVMMALALGHVHAGRPESMRSLFAAVPWADTG